MFLYVFGRQVSKCSTQGQFRIFALKMESTMILTWVGGDLICSACANGNKCLNHEIDSTKSHLIQISLKNHLKMT